MQEVLLDVAAGKGIYKYYKPTQKPATSVCKEETSAGARQCVHCLNTRSFLQSGLQREPWALKKNRVKG